METHHSPIMFRVFTTLGMLWFYRVHPRELATLSFQIPSEFVSMIGENWQLVADEPVEFEK